jgi:nitroreductase
MFLFDKGGDWMEKGLDAVKQRISVRNFSDKAIEPEALMQIEEVCAKQANSGPYGAGVRFRLLDLEPLTGSELRKMGTYGVIKGARYYILGAVRNEKGAMVDLGYCLERIILQATLLGLGTCWLGGTFKRSSFAARMELAEDELLPAITPVGYPACEMSAIEKMMRYGAGSNRRKPWSELFFSADGLTPLAEDAAGVYKDVYNAVRMGPSASNKQPWRLVRDEQGLTHLYLKENKVYNRLMGKIRLQLIDMGIAMCHFEVAARHLRLPGGWDLKGKAPQIKGFKYIASWE